MLKAASKTILKLALLLSFAIGFLLPTVATPVQHLSPTPAIESQTDLFNGDSLNDTNDIYFIKNDIDKNIEFLETSEDQASEKQFLKDQIPLSQTLFFAASSTGVNQAFFFRNHLQTQPVYLFCGLLDPPFLANKPSSVVKVVENKLPRYALQTTLSAHRLANWKDSNLQYTGCITYA